MQKEIIVNVGERETRIAVLEEGKLVELHVEREERVVGNLYLGRVENVLRGMDAAFVDCGLERNVFLYVGDVLPANDSDTAPIYHEEAQKPEKSPRTRRPFRRSSKSKAIELAETDAETIPIEDSATEIDPAVIDTVAEKSVPEDLRIAELFEECSLETQPETGQLLVESEDYTVEIADVIVPQETAEPELLFEILPEEKPNIADNDVALSPKDILLAATSVPLTLEEKEPVQVTEEAAESVILDGSIGENIGVAAITEETAAAYLDSFNFALDGEPDENFEDESGEPGDDIFESDVPDPETGEPASAGRKPMERRRSIKRQALKQQKIDDVVKLGQELLLQVTKGPRGTKGARVSTRVSLPGRYLVLMPEADNVGVSRKIEDGRERDRLKKIGEKLREPGYGIIIRTEAEDKTEAELFADKEFLLQLWKDILAKSKTVRAPALVHQDLTLVYKTIRDVFGSDVQKLIVDDPREFEKANEILEMVSPKLKGRVHLYTSDVPIFDHYGIETEIEKSLKRKVWLRSGGYLIFDETEALTVIDVNTGKFTGSSSLNETIVKTNIDAALETARQLRLRDIGGIIVIDFIDMNNAKDKQLVIRALETALKKDRSRTKISNISQLGLIEMTRKRTGETVSAFMTEPCSFCGGSGKISSAETVSLIAERDLRKTAKLEKKPREALHITCHPDVAEYLIGQDSENVDRIEREIQRAIYVRSSASIHPEKFDIVAGEIAEFDFKFVTHKRQQVIECYVGRSILSADNGVVGWANGCCFDLGDAKKWLGQKVKVKITEVGRSHSSASVIPGAYKSVDRSELL